MPSFSDFLHLVLSAARRPEAQVPRMSENASDFPEPGAIARSQSSVEAFSLTVALKMPYSFERT